MQNLSPTTGQPRLRGPVFYGIVLTGFTLGLLLCSLGGWLYVQSADSKPSGRRIWESSAKDFVIPISCMIGATFGGIGGVAAAVLISTHRWKS